MIATPLKRILSLLLACALAFSGLLASPRPARAASIVVNTPNDENGENTQRCSLREAVIAANRNIAYGGCPAGSRGHDWITLPRGRYLLDRGGKDNTADKGDLDILETVSIVGSGPGVTEIIGMGTLQDRIFHVNAPGGPVTLANMTISNGNASSNLGGTTGGQAGGGVYSLTELILSSVVFYQNTAGTGGGVGGGLATNKGAVTTIFNSTFTLNTASYGGGIYNEGRMEIRSSLLSGNLGNSVGGGIDHLNDILTITNSTIAQNTSNLGSGIAGASAVNMINVTVANNVTGASNVSGAGLHLFSVATFNLRNTIIAGHTKNCSFVEAGRMDASQGYNLEDRNDCKLTGATNKNTAFLALAPTLAPNGGPTLTYALEAGSDAINFVPFASCPPTDQRNFGRTVPVCDAGAFETDAVTFLTSIPLTVR